MMRYEHISKILTEEVVAIEAQLVFLDTKINGSIEKLKEIEDDRAKLIEELMEYKRFLGDIDGEGL